MSSVNPFSAQGTITADAWGTGKRNDCYWNIAKNQLGEGASAQEISALTEELIALNNEKAGKAGQRDTMIKDEQAIFIPLEYAMDEIKENVTNAQTAYTETTAKVTEIQGKFTEATTAVNTALAGLNTATSEMKAAEEALKSVSDEDPSFESLQTALNDMQVKFQEALIVYQDALTSQQEVQSELNTATEELETLAKNLEEFQKELQETMEEYNSEKNEYGKELEELQAEVDNLTEQTQNVETELQNAKTAQEAAQSEIDNSQETVSKVFTTNEEGEMELDPEALKTAAEGLTDIPDGEIPAANQGEGGEDNPLDLKEGDSVSDNGDGTWTVTHPDGTTEVMKQDEDGNWVSNNEGDKGEEVIPEYGLTNAEIEKIKSEGHVYKDGVTYEFDSNGDLISTEKKVDESNQRKDLITRRVAEDGTTTTYEYDDKLGWVETVTDSEGKVISTAKKDNKGIILEETKDGVTTHQQVVKDLIKKYDDASGATAKGKVLNEILNNGDLSAKDMANLMDKIDFEEATKDYYFWADPNAKNNYINKLNDAISKYSGEELQTFLNAYQSKYGHSYMEAIQNMQSSSKETDSLKKFISVFDSQIQDSIAMQLKNNEHTELLKYKLKENGNILKQVLDNAGNDQQSKQEALAVLYNEYGSSDGIIDALRRLGNSEQEKYAPILQQLYQNVAAGIE